MSRNYTLFGFNEDNKLCAYPVTVPVKLDANNYLEEKGKSFGLRAVTWRHTAGKKIYEPYLAIWIHNEDLDMYEAESLSFSSYDLAYSFLTTECDRFDYLYGLYNLSTQKMEKVKIYDWDDRSTAKNTKEAMEYISHYLAESWGSIEKSKANQVAKYAEEYGIPFSADLAVTFHKVFQLHQPQWNSSSAYC
jgi:hypothetical protein